jgi:hypothetical protein
MKSETSLKELLLSCPILPPDISAEKLSNGRVRETDANVLSNNLNELSTVDRPFLPSEISAEKNDLN